jgi:hypothetical protein
MTGPHSADPPHRATPGAARSPEELREDLGTLRAELGDTVEELAHRVDVPSRVRAKREETTARVQEQVTQARAALAEKAPTVDAAVRDQRTLIAAISLVLSYLLVSRMRRRKQRRKAARAEADIAVIGRDGNGTR